MNLTEAIAVLNAEKDIQGVDMLTLLTDIKMNEDDYRTNTKAILIAASNVFCDAGRAFFEKA